MTNITKAAQQALEALESLVHNTPYDGRYSDAIIHLRAALQDKAGEVRGDAWFCGNCRIPVPAPLAPVVPDDHPLVVFAKECELGTYMEHETPMAARKAISAAKAIGITAKAEGGAP